MRLPLSVRSLVLVAVQLAALAYLLLTGPIIARQPLWMSVEIAALLLMAHYNGGRNGGRWC